MVITKITWPRISGSRARRQELLPSMVSTLAPDFESKLTVILDSNNKLVSIRTWPSQEVAQAWIDYVVANFEVLDAIIAEESPEDFENASIITFS